MYSKGWKLPQRVSLNVTLVCKGKCPNIEIGNLQLVHSDLTGPITPESKDGHKCVMVFVGDYRVSQTFVPLITCDITFDRNYTSAWNFPKEFIALLSTYIQKVYIRHALLCLLSRFEAVATWSGISHVAWRAGFSSRLVWAVYSDPSWF